MFKANREKNWSLGLGSNKEFIWQSVAIDDPDISPSNADQEYMYKGKEYISANT